MSLRFTPEEGQWICRKCGDPLVPRPVSITYLEGAFTVELAACPSCGLALVPENLATGRMLEVEQLLEDK